MRRNGATRVWLVLACLSILSACARDSEEDVRKTVSRFAAVTKTLFFASKSRCTVGVFAVDPRRPGLTIPTRHNNDDARLALRTAGVSAIRIFYQSPAEMTDSLLMEGDGLFGKEALHAGSLASDCLDGSEERNHFRKAMTRRGATMVYDTKSTSMMILDPDSGRLFFLTGDVW